MSQPITRIYRPPNKSDNFFKELGSTIANILTSHSLAHRIFVRNVKGQYRSSVFGLLWAFLPPLLSAATWIFLNMARVVQLNSPAEIPYPVFVLTGTVIWQSFSESISNTLSTVSQGKSTMSKLNFKRESLVLAGLYTSLFNSMIKLVVFLPLLVIMGLPISIHWVWFPLFFLAFVFVGHTIGILLTPISLLFGDVQKGIGMVLQLLFFFTPVIYDKPPSSTFGRIIELNPITPLILNAKNGLLDRAFVQIDYWSLIVGAAVLLYVFGLLVFNKAIPQIIARMGG